MDLIRVGSFEVFPGERLLCSGGKPVEIGSRAFDLLLVLAENPGRLVTKSTLIERVWPRLVVDENNLPAQIASLRRMLGAGAIRTVPRFGYRLDLTVSRAVPAGEPTVDGESRADERPPVPLRIWASQPGSLVGREADIESIRRALDRARLVTLVGAAGVGKSRVAQEILARDPEESGATAAFVSLESLDSIERLPSAIALAVGVSPPDTPDRFQGLGQALGSLRLLLVLDGAEHLAASLAAPLSALASQSPDLRVLVTSQIPLGRAGEAIYRLGALPVADAVVMFGQRASLADQRFELGARNEALVAEICRRLDGNPLAVELAAARVAAFGLAALLEHLDDRFRLLRLSGTPEDPRHGVLQAAFDWSYELLLPAERRVFDGLGAFAGSFSLDAAGEAHDARRRMAHAMSHVLDRAYDDYWSADEAVWLHQNEPELDNVRAALEWARQHDPQLAVSLYGSTWPLFVETDLHAEGRAGQDEAVGFLNETLPRRPERRRPHAGRRPAPRATDLARALARARRDRRRRDPDERRPVCRRASCLSPRARLCARGDRQNRRARHCERGDPQCSPARAAARGQPAVLWPPRNAPRSPWSAVRGAPPCRRDR